MIQQGLFKGMGCLFPLRGELLIDLIAGLPRRLFSNDQLLKGRINTALAELLPQLIPQIAQGFEIPAMATLKSFQQSQAVLQLLQSRRITRPKPCRRAPARG